MLINSLSLFTKAKSAVLAIIFDNVRMLPREKRGTNLGLKKLTLRGSGGKMLR
jgi:hypothetical protein